MTPRVTPPMTPRVTPPMTPQPTPQPTQPSPTGPYRTLQDPTGPYRTPLDSTGHLRTPRGGSAHPKMGKSRKSVKKQWFSSFSRKTVISLKNTVKRGVGEARTHTTGGTKVRTTTRYPIHRVPPHPAPHHAGSQCRYTTRLTGQTRLTRLLSDTAQDPKYPFV